MKKLKVSINGFGRIGRTFCRAFLNSGIDSAEIVAINDLASADILAHLLKYDSNYGVLNKDVSVEGNKIVVGKSEFEVLSYYDPLALPWAELSVDIVVECTGLFNDILSASKHLSSGAKRVILSAPAKDKSIPMVVIGISDLENIKDSPIVSNASCTTNCLAPIVKVLNDSFGIVNAYMNTVHAYTSDQNLHDAPHKDLRRARSALNSIIPTSTGAARAIGLIIPSLDGKIDGIATRVPVSVGSMVDLTAVLGRSVTIDEVNLAMKEASEGQLTGILNYTNQEVVSADIVGTSYSCIFDSTLTKTNGPLVKVIGWYDNEYAYACRLFDLVCKLIP
jgi:glyceraldehyde 3-phosphate dehydrogenase